MEKTKTELQGKQSETHRRLVKKALENGTIITMTRRWQTVDLLGKDNIPGNQSPGRSRDDLKHAA